MARRRPEGDADRGRGGAGGVRTPGTGLLGAVELILDGRGKVVVTGMGKSEHVARKIAATLQSTGTPVCPRPGTTDEQKARFT